MQSKLRIGIIGFGNMGKAIAESLFSATNCSVYGYDKDSAKTNKAKKITIAKNSADLIKNCPVIVIAIKPQDIKEFVTKQLKCLKQTKPLLISIAAGVSTGYFEKKINDARVIRVMPNLAAKIRESISFICKGKYATGKDLVIAKNIFKTIGIVFVISETLIDKATAISGSGPGYVYYFMNCLYENARKLGFDKKTARQMVTKTFLGAAKLAGSGNKSFSQLVNEVTSAKGTTEAALKQFENSGLNKAITKGVNAAYKRANKLNIN